LRGDWLIPIHNGTFDLALHRWHEPFERVIGLAAVRGIALATPRMGERLDLGAPHRGERWWRRVVDAVDAVDAVETPKTARRWLSCRDAGQANS
jgi:hypothetical protein